MNKLTYTTILLLSSILAFAQESRPTRQGQFDSQGGNMETLDAPGVGGEFVPIDNYQFLLLGLAVLLIAYFVYRRTQAQKA